MTSDDATIAAAYSNSTAWSWANVETKEECHEIFHGQLMPARSEGPVSGNQKASASTFFTLNGIRPEAEGEAITDTDTAVKALSVAGELPVNPAAWSTYQGFFDSSQLSTFESPGLLVGASHVRAQGGAYLTKKAQHWPWPNLAIERHEGPLQPFNDMRRPVLSRATTYMG